MQRLHSSCDQDYSSIPELQDHYEQVRQRSLDIAHPLSESDMCIQSMTDASPIRWHLAHTTWFFETFILRNYVPHYRPLDEHYNYLFNSYYNGIGKQFPRSQRGTQTRPSVTEIIEYRHFVDKNIRTLLQSSHPEIDFLVHLGLNHEQQHQELMLTDLKHGFSLNPAFPIYKSNADNSPHEIPVNKAEPLKWLDIPEGVYEIGVGSEHFAYDNEQPKHKQYIQSVSIAARLITNSEYLQFIEDGGYKNPQLWLSDGWDWLTQNKRQGPLYWHLVDDRWHEYSLSGLVLLNPSSPVTHINFYEANAYANWAGCRLPTEFEWEAAAQLHATEKPQGNFFETEALHPQPIQPGALQFWGDAWEWTASSYSAYPGYQPFAGNAGEYNGKFMCNQYVLRGGSCVTPISHIRRSYRNFFYPHQSWQFTGIRLTQDQ